MSDTTTTCVWSDDGDDSNCWATQCGHYFEVNEGTLGDDNAK